MPPKLRPVSGEETIRVLKRLGLVQIRQRGSHIFRNWLRANPSDRLLYERTKRELALKNWKYTQNYADAKTTVVEEIIARAQKIAGSGSAMG